MLSWTPGSTTAYEKTRNYEVKEACMMVGVWILLRACLAASNLCLITRYNLLLMSVCRPNL